MKFFLLLIPLSIIACTTESSNSETFIKNIDSTKSKITINIDTNNTCNSKLITELPNQVGSKYTLDSINSEYTLASIITENSKFNQINLVLDQNDKVILETVKDSFSLNLFELDLENINYGGSDFKLSWAQINEETLEEELIINWSQTDGTSGFNSGFEEERRGLIILDVANGQDILNFTYFNHYSSYVNSEDIETDEHGKMNESSEWEICHYEYDFYFNGGTVSIFNLETEHKNIESCTLPSYKEGHYEYKPNMNKFVWYDINE